MAQSNKMQTAKEQFSNIANDLMNIEVNIILKEDIPVQKMPDPRHALIDIGKIYGKTLRSLSYLAEPCADPDQIEREEAAEWEENNWDGSFDAFDDLRSWADEILDCLAEYEDLTTQEKTDLSILSRIKDNSDQIKGIFTALILRDEDLGISEDNLDNPNDVVSILDERSDLDDHQKRYLTNRFSRAQLVVAQSNIEKYPPLELTPDEVVLLRKIWEIGV